LSDFNRKESIENLKKETAQFLVSVRDMSSTEKTDSIKKLTSSIQNMIKHGQEKVALSSSTYELVDNHIQRLDEDLIKYEEEQLSGPRLPGGQLNTTRMVHDVRQRTEAVAAKGSRNGVPPVGFEPYDGRRRTTAPCTYSFFIN
jgi:hypothetical protein